MGTILFCFATNKLFLDCGRLKARTWGLSRVADAKAPVTRSCAPKEEEEEAEAGTLCMSPMNNPFEGTPYPYITLNPINPYEP